MSRSRKSAAAGSEPAAPAESTRSLVMHLGPEATAGVRALTKAFGKSQEVVLSYLAKSINWQEHLSELVTILEAEQRAKLAPLFKLATPPQPEGEPDA